MDSFRYIAALFLVCSASGFTFSQPVTPIAKVVNLITDLRLQVEADGRKEATEYAAFSCFCKDASQTKSKAITDGKDNIALLSASIEDKTAEKAVKQTELDNREKEQDRLNTELEKTTVRCAKEAEVYAAENADLTKAIQALSDAMASLEGGKSFLSIRTSVEKSLLLAASLNMTSQSKRQAVQTFIQRRVDPSSPEYKYHSQGIIDTLKDLHTDFTKKKADLDLEFGKTKKALR